jgi:flagellar motor protein MotB
MRAEKRRQRRKEKAARRRRDQAYKPAEKGMAQPVSFMQLMSAARRGIVQPVLGPRVLPKKPPLTGKADDTRAIVARARSKVQRGKFNAPEDPTPSDLQELQDAVPNALRPKDILYERVQGGVLQDAEPQED